MHKILPRRTAFNKWTNEANAGKKDCCPIDNKKMPTEFWGHFRETRFWAKVVKEAQNGPHWPKRSKITGRSKNLVSQHRPQIPVRNLFWDNVMYYAVRRRQADSVEHCLNSIALHTLVVCAISSLNIAFFLCTVGKYIVTFLSNICNRRLNRKFHKMWAGQRNTKEKYQTFPFSLRLPWDRWV